MYNTKTNFILTLNYNSMFHFIYAIGAQNGFILTPAQIKKITKHVFKSGKPLSEELVKDELKRISA